MRVKWGLWQFILQVYPLVKSKSWYYFYHTLNKYMKSVSRNLLMNVKVIDYPFIKMVLFKRKILNEISQPNS